MVSEKECQPGADARYLPADALREEKRCPIKIRKMRTEELRKEIRRIKMNKINKSARSGFSLRV